MTVGKTRCVVLISGRGSNLEALLIATRASDYPAAVVAVISNKSDAAGLQLARDAGVPIAVLPNSEFTDRAAYDLALQAMIDTFAPDLVVLAGFMRILTPAFVAHYQARLVNIHPSLLPAFTGLHTHERALAAGVRFHGCTVHFVTAELDHGPIIAQGVLEVGVDDDALSLATRVLALEHRIYPLAVRWFAEGRLRIDGQCVRLAGQANPQSAMVAPSLEVKV